MDKTDKAVEAIKKFWCIGCNESNYGGPCDKWVVCGSAKELMLLLNDYRQAILSESDTVKALEEVAEIVHMDMPSFMKGDKRGSHRWHCQKILSAIEKAKKAEGEKK